MSAEVDSPPRPSHDRLMEATEALSAARDIERAAGNVELSMVLNDCVLSLFKLALRAES